MQEYQRNLDIIREIVTHLEKCGPANYQNLHVTFDSNSDRYAGLGNILQGMIVSGIIKWCEAEEINIQLKLEN